MGELKGGLRKFIEGKSLGWAVKADWKQHRIGIEQGHEKKHVVSIEEETSILHWEDASLELLGTTKEEIRRKARS